MPDLTQIAQVLQSLFTDQAVKLAQESGLVRRQSKLSGPLLLLILVSGFIQHPTASLNLLAQIAHELGVIVTRQGIHQRLNASAVVFFQHIFQHSLERLQNRYRLSVALLNQFTAVYLLDSSQVPLPEGLAEQYPGTGGDGPKAGMKWQVLWEVLSGNLQAEELSPTKAWQTFQRQVESLFQAVRQRAGVEAVLNQLYALWARFALKERRQKRPTTLRQLEAELVNSLT